MLVRLLTEVEVRAQLAEEAVQVARAVSPDRAMDGARRRGRRCARAAVPPGLSLDRSDDEQPADDQPHRDHDRCAGRDREQHAVQRTFRRRPIQARTTTTVSRIVTAIATSGAKTSGRTAGGTPKARISGSVFSIDVRERRRVDEVQRGGGRGGEDRSWQVPRRAGG